LIGIVKKYSCYNGGIYTNFKNVNVVTEEGRSFLRSTDKKFDLIILPLAIVKTSRSAEGYILTENYLYTTDAIKDYLSHLTNDGQLVFLLHERAETYRVISIALPVLEKMGLTIPQAMNNFYIVGREKMVLLVVKKNAFDRDEIFARHALAHKLRLYKGRENDRMVFFPYLGWGKCKITYDMLTDAGQVKTVREEFKDCDKMDKTLTALYIRSNLSNWLKTIGFDTRLVTDNRPFFYNFDGRPPKTLENLLYLSIIIVIGSVFIPPSVAFLSRGVARAVDGVKSEKTMLGRYSVAARFILSRNWRYIVIFFLLGAGFMMTEIALIQKFILFLGQPVLSLSILLLSLFIGMGFGGLISKFFLKTNRTMGITLMITLLIGLTGTYIGILPMIFMKYLGCTLLAKILISICLLAPLGILMGMPFPSMLNLLKLNSRELIIPWMWGINGVSSVFGSMLAIVVGIIFGFDKVLLAGILMYASIIVILKIKN